MSIPLGGWRRDAKLPASVRNAKRTTGGMASKGVEVEWKEGEGRKEGMASASSLKGRGRDGWGGGSRGAREHRENAC